MYIIFRALSQASGIASNSRDPGVCDQMKGSLIKKQVINIFVQQLFAVICTTLHGIMSK